MHDWKFLLFTLYCLSTCLAQLNKQIAGPYDVVVHYLENCLKTPSSDTINPALKLKKLNRSTVAVDGILYFGVPFDDDMIASVKLDQFTNGGWKENYFKQDFKNACSTIKKFAPTVLKRALEASNVKPTTCPVAKGNYTMKNMVLSVEVPEVPIFFYNKYRYSCTGKVRGKTVVCVQAEVDIVPKRTKKG